MKTTVELSNLKSEKTVQAMGSTSDLLAEIVGLDHIF